jgi:hypothetical protein
MIITMTDKKVWNNVSNSLSEILKNTLQPAQAEVVMKAWTEKKSELTKILSKNGSRPPKDPNAPRRAISSYIIFCNQNRELLKNANPSLKTVELTKLLGQRWKALTPQEKAPYENAAAQDKLRFETESKNYVAPPEYQRSKRTREGPKKPLTAYLIFANANRESMKRTFPALKMTDLAKKLGERWRSLSAEERAPFENKAQEAKAAYEAASGKSAKKEKVAKPAKPAKTATATAPVQMPAVSQAVAPVPVAMPATVPVSVPSLAVPTVPVTSRGGKQRK